MRKFVNRFVLAATILFCGIAFSKTSEEINKTLNGVKVAPYKKGGVEVFEILEVERLSLWREHGYKKGDRLTLEEINEMIERESMAETAPKIKSIKVGGDGQWKKVDL